MKNLFAKKLTKREKTLLKLIAMHWKKLIAAMLCMIVAAAATSVSAYLVKPMLDDIFINKNKTELLILPGAAVLIFFLKGMVSTTVTRFTRDAFTIAGLTGVIFLYETPMKLL